MSEPTEQRTKWLYRESSAGSAQVGLTTSDFSVVAAYKVAGSAAVAWTHASTFTCLGTLLGAAWNGWYAWTYTMPPAEADCMIHPKVASGTDLLSLPAFSGEQEWKDVLSAFNAANKPLVSVSGEGTIGQEQALTLIAKRYRVITFTFEDENGDPIDMTAGTTYTGYAWSVRAASDQTLTPPKYDQTTNIVGGSGFVTVTVLESASFFDALTEGASPSDTYECRHELTADLVAVAGETVSLVPSSLLTLSRREVGT